jgi:hypothetical protein
MRNPEYYMQSCKRGVLYMPDEKHDLTARTHASTRNSLHVPTGAHSPDQQEHELTHGGVHTLVVACTCRLMRTAQK